jgi:peptide/nickel transport system substrate-binding protein
MRRKIAWLALSCIIVTAMLLSSCGKTTTTSTTTVQTTTTTSTTTTASTTTSTTTPTSTTSTVVTTATTGTTTGTINPGSLSAPTYGGTLTLFISSGNQDPTGWDHMYTSDLGSGARWGNPYMEWLLTGDIAKYGLGPGASGAFAFNLYEGVPEQYFGGVVASGWTVQLTPVLTYTWTIRQGIMFTGNTNIGMAPRALTAADVVYSEQRAMMRSGFAAAFSWLSSTQATGTYTVVWTCASFYTNWAWRLGGTALGQIWAQEVVNATAQGGPDNWKNACGSGPFILTSYIQGSEAEYTRNTNYWGSVTINGKSYQEPFIQKLDYPIIPDISTQIAAVRTGKLDWDPKVPVTYQANLASSAPQMTATQYVAGTVDFLKYNRLTSAVVNQQAVRQALQIGTDLNTIATLEYGGGIAYSWPLAPGAAGYVPLNQLPSNIQTLWTYNPTLAKQMLTTAGFPNGFTIQIDVGPVQTQQDVANILASEWKQINVTVKINVIDATTAAAEYNNVTYKDAMMSNFTDVNPFTALNLARAGLAGSTYLTSDPSGMEAMYVQAAANADVASRELQLEKLQEAYQWDCGGLGFANPYVLNCWWPWLKNYYGELDASYYNQIPMIKRMWIDQTMKAGLGH